MDWNSALKGYKLFLRLEKALSENSIVSYLNDINKLQQFIDLSGSTTPPNQITTDQIRAMLNWLNEIGISLNSQARLISGIKSFFNYLDIENELTENPTHLIEAPRIGRKLPDTLSHEEVDQLIGAINLSSQEGHRNKAILETLYSCGLRVSELINLQISKLYFKDEFIVVIGKGDKERLVPISGVAIKNINIYVDNYRNKLDIQKGHEDYVFLNRRGKQLTRVMIFTIIKQLVAQTGINKSISPHTFRHSFASELVNRGADLRAVQEMLGHESITTTEIYTHLDKNYLRETILDYHPRS